jgi:hypothetical protein
VADYNISILKKLKDRQDDGLLIFEKLKNENTIKEKNSVIVLSIHSYIIISKIISKKLGYDFGLIMPQKINCSQ